MKNLNYDIAVIGGGAGGLCASVTAGLSGLKVALIEGSNRTGKKLSVTGNGQGNIANNFVKAECYNNGDFVLKVFEKIPLQSLLSFFSFIGIEVISKENGRLYPLSLQASSVLDCLRLKNKELFVEEICNFFVVNISKKNDVFYIKSSDGNIITAKSVIIACGGKASPHLNCGQGYNLLADFGHSLTKLLPSLVQLKTQKQAIRHLKGVRIETALKLSVNGKTLKSSFGDVIFTEYGVSGLSVFEISGNAIRSLDNKDSVVLSLDTLPDIDLNILTDMLNKRKDVLKDRTAEFFLTGFLPKQFAKTVLEISDISPSKLVKNIDNREIKLLANSIKDFKLEVTGSLGFEYAQVTAGGIDVKDFDENLMSKFCKNLFACGEVLDIDGNCGGYNLMWAFCSGILCGQQAVKIFK